MLNRIITAECDRQPCPHSPSKTHHTCVTTAIFNPFILPKCDR
ncbi:hypothetical protein [Nostoc sp. CCY 9925]